MHFAKAILIVIPGEFPLPMMHHRMGTSSWAICRLDRFKPMKYRHRIQTRNGWW